MSDQSTDWLDSTTASRLLGVAPNTLRSWAQQGKIRAWRTIGGRYVYARADVFARLPQPVAVSEDADEPERESTAD